jgi:cellulase/cellobiase CelA1
VPKTKKSPTATPSEKPPATVDDEPPQDTDTDGVIENPGTETDEANPDQGDIRVAEVPQVAVDFEVLRQDDTGYAARIVVRNQGADLSGGWTLELPVGGQVTAVDGVPWEQRGGPLLITPVTPLAAGDELTITFDADGTAESPSECTLSEGECRLSAV